MQWKILSPKLKLCSLLCGKARQSKLSPRCTLSVHTVNLLTAARRDAKKWWHIALLFQWNLSFQKLGFEILLHFLHSNLFWLIATINKQCLLLYQHTFRLFNKLKLLASRYNIRNWWYQLGIFMCKWHVLLLHTVSTFQIYLVDIAMETPQKIIYSIYVQ